MRTITPPEGWTPAPEKIAYTPGDKVTHTNGRHFTIDRHFYKPTYGYGPVWAGEECRDRHTTTEYEALKALAGLPHILPCELVMVGGEQYIEMPIVEPLELDDTKSRRAKYDREYINDHIAGIEDTLREMDRRGWDYGDPLQFGYRLQDRTVYLIDFSTCYHSNQPIHLIGNASRAYRLIETCAPSLHTMRQTAKEYFNVKRETFERWECGRTAYLYASFARPYSYMSAGGLKRDFGVVPDTYEMFHSLTGANWTTGKPHTYILSSLPWPDALLKAHELTLVHQPGVGCENDHGRWPKEVDNHA